MAEKNNSKLAPEDFAAEVVRVVNANMEKTIRVVSNREALRGRKRSAITKPMISSS